MLVLVNREYPVKQARPNNKNRDCPPNARNIKDYHKRKAGVIYNVKSMAVISKITIKGKPVSRYDVAID